MKMHYIGFSLYIITNQMFVFCGFLMDYGTKFQIVLSYIHQNFVHFGKLNRLSCVRIDFQSSYVFVTPCNMNHSTIVRCYQYAFFWMIKMTILNGIYSWIREYHKKKVVAGKSFIRNNHIRSGLWIHLHALVCRWFVWVSLARMCFFCGFIFVVFFSAIKHPWKIKCSSLNCSVTKRSEISRSDFHILGECICMPSLCPAYIYMFVLVFLSVALSFVETILFVWTRIKWLHFCLQQTKTRRPRNDIQKHNERFIIEIKSHRNSVSRSHSLYLYIDAYVCAWWWWKELLGANNNETCMQ